MHHILVGADIGFQIVDIWLLGWYIYDYGMYRIWSTVSIYGYTYIVQYVILYTLN